MYDVKKIAACLKGLIGFRQETSIPDNVVIDEDLQDSSSGLYWQQAHALVTLQNLLYISPDFTTDADFNKWLDAKTHDSITKVLAAVIQKKKLAKNVKTLLEDVYLFEGAANYFDKEVRNSRFVGFQIIIKGHQGLTAIINKISTQFDTAQNKPLKLYLYHSSNIEPVKTFGLAATKARAIEWHDISDGLLSYVTDTTDAGGVWFLGYYEDDLQGQAYNKTNFNFSHGPCMCEPYYYNLWAAWFQYISVVPFYVYTSDLPDDKTLWNFSYMHYMNENKTFGLNLNISVSCNVTDLICRQKSIFQNAILYQFGVDILHEIASSTRTNHIQEKTQQKALYYLDDQENGTAKGLKTMLANEIDAVEFDFSGLNSVCVPCSASNGVTYGVF